MAIQIRRGTKAGWDSNKSNIVAGEPAIATDTGEVFVGTGNGTYVELASTDYVDEAVAESGGGEGLSSEAKQALLACFEKVAWIDENGQTYVDALETALYPPASLRSISAVYTQSGSVYVDDSLDSLRTDLVVTATYTDSSTAIVTTYTLSGTLVKGTSTITVAYGGKTTTFSVTVKGSAREDIFGTFEDGIAVIRTNSVAEQPYYGSYVCVRASAEARASANLPIENKGYVFTVTDSSKYNICAYAVSNDTQIRVASTDPRYIDGYCYLADTQTVAWKTTDSVASDYVWLALKKMDGTAFTSAELENGAEAVFTYTSTS